MASDLTSQNLVDLVVNTQLDHHPQFVEAARTLGVEVSVLVEASEVIGHAYSLGREMAEIPFEAAIINPFTTNRLKEAWQLGLRDRKVEIRDQRRWLREAQEQQRKRLQEDQSCWKDAFEDEWLKEGF